MKQWWFRSLIFNVAFFCVTALLSVIYVPLLILPRPVFGTLIRFWLRCVYALEYSILNLNYKIAGLENLPKEGSYIVAAKHQSAYETLKLHLLFHEPAVILKRELLWIPLFGWYLQKSGAIAIDRGSPETAHKSIREGAIEVMARNRPIIIFPQGTRVSIDATPQDKPYKVGVARLQEATGLPIVPVAMNSGWFWPRNSWLKKPGTVTFQILKPIYPGKDRYTLMKELEDTIETTSDALVLAARRRKSFDDVKEPQSRKKIFFIALLIGLTGLYCVWWQQFAKVIQQEYAALHDDAAPLPVITGFPWKMNIYLDEEKFTAPDGTLTLKGVTLRGFPLPGASIHVMANVIEIDNMRWRQPLVLQNNEVWLRYWGNSVTIIDSLVTRDDFRASAAGTIDLKDRDIPVFDLMISFLGHQNFMAYMAANNMIDQQSAAMMNMGFNALQNSDGIVSVPVTQRGRTLYAGPFAFAEIPEKKPVITDPLSAGMDTPPAPSR
jgi:1-acyl-sn-glycerol-3-phosphate acyltransferase